MNRTVLAIDQSTQGTKALLFDERGGVLARCDKPHCQIVNEKGWVEHDPVEVLENTLCVCAEVIKKASVANDSVTAIGISNQRETTVAWDKQTGKPLCNAIVWQCGRAAKICERPEFIREKEQIHRKTGLPLSPFFPAAKLKWLTENCEDMKTLSKQGRLAVGTIDSWLVYSLTGHHKTDYSNASRTQLFNITELKWDAEMCTLFGVPESSLPDVCMSDSIFGSTNLKGLLPRDVPICGVLGDSHGALFGQNCRLPGQVKATYGTGSSVMMHIGSNPKFSDCGLSTSLAWGIGDRVAYVLEGNINYTGAVMTWLEKDVGLIQSPKETAELARRANPADKAYFVPAFTGLGAPYWNNRATGLLTGITRTTGKPEIVKACLESIAYQVNDLIDSMQSESGINIDRLRVDGGATANSYLMQFQSDLSNLPVYAAGQQELSAIGAAYLAGISAGIYSSDELFGQVEYLRYTPDMKEETRSEKLLGWKQAIRRVILSPFGTQG